MSYSNKRKGRIEEEIKRYLTDIIYKELDSTELRMASISSVNVTPDFSNANIYFSTYKTSKDEIEKMLTAFKRQNKNIRMSLSKKLKIRGVPILKFFYDDTLDSYYKVENLLKKIKKDDEDRNK